MYVVILMRAKDKQMALFDVSKTEQTMFILVSVLTSPVTYVQQTSVGHKSWTGLIFGADVVELRAILGFAGIV